MKRANLKAIVIVAIALPLHIHMSMEAADARRRARRSRPYYRPVSAQVYNGASFGSVTPPSGRPYANGSMNATKLDELMGLDFSNGQSYGAMRNAFGLPTHRTASADYYRMPNNAWLRVNYREDGKASGYTIGDSHNSSK